MNKKAIVIARSEATKQSLKEQPILSRLPRRLRLLAMTAHGFMLLEAILTVVIVSICLTFIAQSLWTNFRTGVRFQETVRSLMVMENKLGILYATDASEDQLELDPQALDKPYDKFTISAQAATMNDHLKNVELKLNWPTGRTQGHLNVATIIYNPDET